MKTLLVGNGIDIQYGGNEYLNSTILKRAIDIIDRGLFNSEVYTKEVEELFFHLYAYIPIILSGKVDYLAVTSYEKTELREFKRKYSKVTVKNFTFYMVGIEDYLFIFELFCRHHNIQNPELFGIRELLKRWLIDSIYNNGKVNEIYLKFPPKLIEFFSSYSKIFTTNYDENIERFCGKQVFHLHGEFNELSEVYDKNSFRNQLSDCPVSTAPVIEGYEHVFSTAILSFTGSEKEFQMKMGRNANQMISKIITGISNNRDIADQVESWKNSDSQIIRNFYEAIQLKSNNKNLTFKDSYHLNEFTRICGIIDIVGLSPNNDIHIFRMLNDNPNLNEVNFYFYDRKEVVEIRRILSKKHVKVYSVKELWQRYQ